MYADDDTQLHRNTDNWLIYKTFNKNEEKEKRGGKWNREIQRESVG